MEKHIYVKEGRYIELHCNCGCKPDIHDKLLEMGWKKIYMPKVNTKLMNKTEYRNGRDKES